MDHPSLGNNRPARLAGKRLAIWLWMLGLWPGLGWGQAPAQTDSLHHLWQQADQPKAVRLEALDQWIADALIPDQLDSVGPYARQQLRWAEAQDQPLYAARAQVTLGLAYREQSQVDSATFFLSAALARYDKLNVPQERAATALKRAQTLRVTGDYAEAIKDFFASLKAGERLGDSAMIAASTMGIGLTYRTQGDMDLAMAYLQRSQVAYQSIGDLAPQVKILNNLAIIRLMARDPAGARASFEEALAAAAAQDDSSSQITLLLNLGGIVAQMGDTDQAMTYLKRCYALAEAQDRRSTMATSLRNIAGVHKMRGEDAQVIAYGRQALALAESLSEIKLMEVLSAEMQESYEALGQYKEALAMHELHVAMRDSVRSANNPKETMRQQMAYEFEKKALEDSLNYVQEQAATTLVYQKQVSNRNYLLLGGLLLAGLGFGAVRYRQQLRLREREAARQQAQARQAQLEELDALKSTFFTNLSREFRTPLTVIMGMARQLPATQTQTAQLITRNGQRLLRLINQLLDLARLEAQSLPLTYIQADILPQFRYLIASLAPLASQRQIDLRLESPLPELVMDHDPGKIQDILSNLIGNALKFTPEGGEVNVRVEADEAAARLQVAIRDTGPGIPQAELPQIFDRFFQGGDSDRDTSSGVGLALVKGLIDQMGGEISVESQPGAGSCFRFWLPIRRIAPQEEVRIEPILEAPTAPAVLPEATASAEERPRVLIIEDQADVITYLAALLGPEYELLTATDGEAGLALAQAEVPDLVVCYVMLPLRDGYAVTQSLKTHPSTSHIPIVMLTARADQADRMAGLAQGADAYLTKPFHQEELLLRLRKLLELRQTLQARYRGEADSPPAEEKAAPSRPTLDDLFLEQIRETLRERLADPTLSIHDLCEAVHLTRTQVYRKIKALTGQTPTLYIRSARLRQARHLLETTALTISEVAYDCGFHDPNYFSRVFLEEFGERPTATREV
ncbi:MAG: helix-turn-helix domain-containing protein [Bacteroidetes bacterium]|nr:MAG: helix-turn-helix domain-containing protein [Bacteroidota bacterium]